MRLLLRPSHLIDNSAQKQRQQQQQKHRKILQRCLRFSIKRFWAVVYKAQPYRTKLFSSLLWVHPNSNPLAQQQFLLYSLFFNFFIKFIKSPCEWECVCGVFVFFFLYKNIQIEPKWNLWYELKKNIYIKNYKKKLNNKKLYKQLINI